MKTIFINLIVLFVLLSANISATNADEVYRYTIPNSEGIGKFYKGREISHIMGYQGISWLERPGRTEDERTDLLLQNLELKEDYVVADIGSGSGYFSFPMAEMVTKGKVLAVDIQQEMLNVILAKKEQYNIDNVETVLANDTELNIDKNTIDLALLVDVYHELEYPFEIMTSLAASLKDDGKVVLVEYRAEDKDLNIKRLHKMEEKQIISEMHAVGLTLFKSYNNLPSQHFLVFKKSDGK